MQGAFLYVLHHENENGAGTWSQTRNQGFADLGLITWLCRPAKPLLEIYHAKRLNRWAISC